MKKLPLILLAVMVFFVCCCDNEVDLYPDDPPPLLFVYGSFNGAGNLQQVRIRQSISKEQDAYVGAKDSTQYLPQDSLEVFVEDEMGNNYPMEPVLMEKEPGIFGTDGNVIYQSVFNLIPNRRYMLEIMNRTSGEVVTAQTRALAEPKFLFPRNSVVLRQMFQFTDPNFPFYIHFSGGSVNTWNIYIKYLDILKTGDTVFQRRMFSGDIHTGNSGIRYFPLDYLYQIIHKMIPVDRAVDYRMFYRFDFDVWVGDDVVAEYIRYFERYPDNRRFVNSNIHNGLGLLYSCNYSKLANVQPYESFLDSLIKAPLTRDLQFSRFMYSGVFPEDGSVAPNPFDL